MKRIIKYFLLTAVLLTVALSWYISQQNRAQYSPLEKAKNLVSQVYVNALSQRKKGTQLEMRFFYYMSGNALAAKVVGGQLYDSLQPYEINPDNTCTPIGEVVHLPQDIVLVPSGSTEGIYTDSEKKLSTIRIDSPDFGEVIDFYDLTVTEQIPENKRLLVVLNGKVYISADNLPLIYANVPGYYDRTSRPVKQP